MKELTPLAKLLHELADEWIVQRSLMIRTVQRSVGQHVFTRSYVFVKRPVTAEEAKKLNVPLKTMLLKSKGMKDWWFAVSFTTFKDKEQQVKNAVTASTREYLEELSMEKVPWPEDDPEGTRDRTEP
jgi:hypothetical protein